MNDQICYEVERKFRLEDESSLRRKVAELGGQFGAGVPQSDQYYAHPARDFALTDEALRIRTTAGRCVVTYKGPKIDSTSKTRRELEFVLPDPKPGQPEFSELLTALGFTPVAQVQKSRCTANIAAEGREFEIAVDDVRQLGLFVELETSASEADLDDARRSLDQLTRRLQLCHDERRSYLELLLDQRSQRAG